MNKILSYAVAIVKRTVGPRCKTKEVGHMPKRISAACNLFLQQSGNIECTTAGAQTGARRYSFNLPQGGLA